MADIPENSQGPDKGLSGDDRPVAAPGKRVKKGERLSEETRRKVSEGVKRSHAERKARERGDRSADRPPKAKARQATASDRRAGELQLIREWAGAALSAPAMAGAAIQDPWLVTHFTTRGPALADALVKEAERNERLRAILVNVATAAGPAALIAQAAMYIALPLMHFGVLPGGAMLGVPVVRQQPPPAAPAPGQQPPFVAPERGPAEAPAQFSDRVPPEADMGPEWVQTGVDEDGLRTFAPADDLAAELAANENGGAVPPLPIEPV